MLRSSMALAVVVACSGGGKTPERPRPPTGDGEQAAPGITWKRVEFGAAAPGMIGLETALSLGLAAVEAGCLELATLLRALGAGPAALIGEARTLAIGSTADLVVFDPAARRQVQASGLASASGNTPLLGMELPGVVRLTVAGGRITYRDGLLAGA